MPRLIVETLQEKPIVLFLGDEAPFVQQLRQAMEARDFETQLLSIPDTTPAQIEKFFLSVADRLYHLVWVCEFWQTVPEKYQVILRLFDRFPQLKKTMIVPVWTPLKKSIEIFPEWSWYTQTQAQFLEYLTAQLPRVSQILVQDCADIHRTPHLPFLAISPVGGHIQVTDPQITLSLINVQSAAGEVARVLLMPKKPKKTLVKGPARVTTELFQTVAAQLPQGVSISLTAAPLSTDKNLEDWKTFEVPTADLSDVKKQITTLIKAVAQPVEPIPFIATTVPTAIPTPIAAQVMPAAPKSAPSLPEFSVKKIVPHSPPLIENRLKKYEYHQQQLKKRKQANLVLPKVAQRTQPPPKIPRQAQLLSAKNTQVELELQRIFGNVRSSQKNTRIQEKNSYFVKTKKKKKRQHWSLVVFGILIGVGLFGGGLWASFSGSTWLVTRAYFDFVDQSQAAQNTAAPSSLKPLAEALTTQVQLYQLVLGKQSLLGQQSLAALAEKTIEVTPPVQQLQAAGEQAFAQVTGQQPGSSVTTLQSITGKASQVYQDLSLLQSQIENYQRDYASEKESTALDKYLKTIQVQRKSLTVLDQLQNVLPAVVGSQEKQTYAVLFQDSEELRATGGFLQSVALVTFEKGAIIDFQVLDSSQIEKNLKGDVQPPEELRRVLGQKKWLLRDANWSPNFVKTASQVSWFVENSLGKSIDGVVALNTHVVQDLLEQVGPVAVPEHNEVVTAKNIFERMEFHSELQIVQSDQPSYQAQFETHLLNTITKLPPEKAAQVFAVLGEDLKNGEVLVSFKDPVRQAVMSSLGWSGEVLTPPCPVQFNDQTCLVDTFMQVEDNVGVNKANHYIERTSSHKISVSTNQVNHDHVLTLKNTSASSAWPAGAYKLYLRFYLPQAAENVRVLVNDSLLPTNLINTTSDSGKKVFGVLVEVPIQQTTKLELQYQETQPQSPHFSYVFFDQKQPGVGEYPAEIQVTPDAGLKPTLIAPQATITQGAITFTTQRQKHSFVGVRF